MLSMPPATTTRPLPARSWSWAIIAVFMPDPHILFSVVQGTDFGSPAPKAACRAGAWPCPAPSTLPISTSSTSSAATPARSKAALIATAPSWLAVAPESSP
jgi:hypothetical protein